MSITWQRFSKRSNPCPVCAGASKECRGFERDDGKLQVHCRGKVDAPHGWGYTGDDAHGFSKFVQGWNDRRDRDWDEIARRRADRQARESREIAARSTAADRDRAYQQLQPNQRLSQSHRAELHRRGLTDASIDFAESRGWLRAWCRGIAAPTATAIIPGIADGTTTGTDGMAIAAPDHRGHIAGFQIRPDRPRPDGAKYPWIAGCGLPSGEMPMPLWRHPQAPATGGTLWIIEGFLKSLIVALMAWACGRYDIAVLGAGGCNWASHPQQLAAAIATTAPAAIELLPDAGALENPHVKRQIQALADHLESQGHCLLYRWWRQASKQSKGSQDPDEIATTAILASPARPWNRGGAIVPWDTYNRLRNRLAWFDDAIAWTVDDWIEAGRPIIQYRSEQRQTVWRWARDNGFIHSLDSSPPGTGKSWDAGIFLESRVFPPQAPAAADGDEGSGGQEKRPPCGWLLDSDPYNPSCETTAALALQAGKHSGLVQAGDRLRTARDGDEPLAEPPSCDRAQSFVTAAAQGHPQVAGKDCSLCHSCPRAEIERDGDAIKSLACSYLAARRELNDSGAPRRAHPQTATVGDGDVVIADETEAIADSTAQTIRANALHTEIANLQHNFPALAAVAAPAIAVAMDALGDAGRFGVSSGALHHRLLVVGPAIWTAWIEAGLGAADGDPWDAPPATPNRAIARAFQLDLEKLARGDGDAAIASAIATAPTARTIAALVAAALDDSEGVSVGADLGTLTLARRNARALNNTRKGAFNLNLDATATAQTLASHLGMGPGHILEMRAVGMSYTNMEIVALHGVGAMGSQREEGNTRAIALVTAIAEKHGDIAVMDRKSRESDYADIPGVHFGAHHRDGRKTNRYQHCRAIAIVGRPCPNLGALAAQWQAKTGQHIPDPAALTGRYGQWVRHKIIAEIIQEIERLRGGRRNAPVTIYLVWDVADAELQAVASAFTGATIARRHAAGLTADGAKGAARRLLPFAEFLRANPDATIDAVATALGVTKGTVSKLAAPWGGFRAISKSFQFLYKPSIENGNFSENQAQSGIQLIKAMGWEISRPAPAATPEQAPAPAMDPTPTYSPGDRVSRWFENDWHPYWIVEKHPHSPGYRIASADDTAAEFRVFEFADRLAPMGAPAVIAG